MLYKGHLRSNSRKTYRPVTSARQFTTGTRDFYALETQQCSGEKRCRRGESNPRPRDYETLALPLSYAGIEQFFMLRIRLRMCQGVVGAWTRRARVVHDFSWIMFDLLFSAIRLWSWQLTEGCSNPQSEESH